MNTHFSYQKALSLVYQYVVYAPSLGLLHQCKKN
jgi:hypothetical protein